MARRDRGLLSDLLQRGSLRRWFRAARGAGAADPAEARLQRSPATALKSRLDAFLATADGRRALPPGGSAALPRPPGTDWAWRPPLWCEPLPGGGAAGVRSPTPLGAGATIFHDCPLAEIAVVQLRNRRGPEPAPFGVEVEVAGFGGSFLSLVLELPREAAAGLKRRHLLRLGAKVEAEKPAAVLARLNVKQGPNVEQLSRELPEAEAEAVVEFDLDATRLDETRVERLWLDLIFQKPAMNRITLRDVTLARYPRADL